MRISVILPIYNNAIYLSEALRSVKRQIHYNDEIIVINDGSTDLNTIEAIHQLENIVLIEQKNAGPAVARNRGLEKSNGDLIAFIDADDLWAPSKILNALVHFDANKSTEIVWAKTELIDPLNNGHEFFGPYLGSAVVRKNVFNHVGLFDEELRFGEDVDWYLRCKELDVQIYYDDRIGLLHRRHDNNSTNNSQIVNQYTLKYLKKKLDRGRKE